MSAWGEERRRDQAAAAALARADRVATAEIEMARQQADSQARIAAMKVRAEQGRKDRAERRRVRTARVAALRGWLVEEAPAAVVMGAPMLLAWTAMAAYGHQVYGPVGWILPLFSEAAMVWFALAVRRAVRDKRPFGWLRVGLVVFAAQSAVLNFVHGIAGAAGSWDRGLVMAVVAVGGVTVHQLITAGPRARRRSRAQRIQARATRLARRRVAAIQRAAVGQAVGELSSDGTVRLVYRAGVVTLQRHGLLRRVRVIEALPAVPEPAVMAAPEPPVPAVVPDGSPLADEVALWLAAQVAPGGSGLAGTAETPGTTAGSDATASRLGDGRSDAAGNHRTGSAGTRNAELLARAQQAVRAGQLPPEPSRRDVQRVLKVRAADAGWVAKAIKDSHDDEGGAVPARV
jgi:hypothetical protein